jgi:hypothetical protein
MQAGVSVFANAGEGAECKSFAVNELHMTAVYLPRVIAVMLYGTKYMMSSQSQVCQGSP